MIRIIFTVAVVLLQVVTNLAALTPLVERETALMLGLLHGPCLLSAGADGAVFVLDVGSAQLYRVDPETGEELWRTDGSESGQPFVDPVWISRPDGFFVFVTDRGLRRVWKVDYRGELRGWIDLPFAADPLLLELAQGSQLALYDRAASLVWLLDDSGRPLWSFAPGEGRQSAEPSALALSPAGDRLYLLWRPAGQVTALSLFGKRSQLDVATLPDRETVRFYALAVEGREFFCCLSAHKLVFYDLLSGQSQVLDTATGPVLDARAAGDRLYLLAGTDKLTLVKIKLEIGD